MEKLDCIFNLEESGDYESAFKEYEKLDFLTNYEYWKHYYFFLWFVNAEDSKIGTEKLVKSYQLDSKLKDIFNIGQSKFENNPDFLFLAGYTISLFPYYYGDYEDWENRGDKMIEQAHELQPDNVIYRLAYYGIFPEPNKEYHDLMTEEVQTISSVFQGNGLLNRYFLDVMTDKKTRSNIV